MADYFTVAEFRGLPDMSSAAAYPDDKVNAAAAHFTSIVEREVGTSFIAREVTETLDGTGRTGLRLSTPYVLSVTSATVNGVAVTDDLTVDAGVLQRRVAGTYTPGTWSIGTRNVVVVYDEGYSTVAPGDVKDSLMWAVRDRLLSQANNAGVDIRKTSVTTEFGTTSYVLPGEKRPTGFPELDAVIAGWARKLNTVTYP